MKYDLPPDFVVVRIRTRNTILFKSIGFAPFHKGSFLPTGNIARYMRIS